MESADTPRCPLCAGTGDFFWEKNGTRACKCPRCGFVFVHPLPRAPLLDDFSHSRAILDAPGHFRSEYHRFLSGIEALTGKGRLLDVGCNIGLSLAVAKERGWEPVGIELSPQAADYGRRHFGVEIIETPLEEAAFPDGAFAAVAMYHVLEHILDPMRLLKETARVLRPGGVLYASVPNAGGIQAVILREKWAWVSPDHAGYFSKNSLAGALAAAGFVPVVITSFLGARVSPRKPRWETRFIDPVSNLLCLSISLESWSRRPRG